MQAFKRIFEHAPPTISIPEQWIQKRMEVILLVREEEQSIPVETKTVLTKMPDVVNNETATDNTHHWPINYFERTFGSIPDFKERESQGAEEIREALE